jgi:hypothetical protein
MNLDVLFQQNASDRLVKRTVEALQREGFGIITEIAMDTDTSPGSQNAGLVESVLGRVEAQNAGLVESVLGGVEGPTRLRRTAAI